MMMTTYEFCKQLVGSWNGRVDSITTRIDAIYLMGRITAEQYIELMSILGVPANNE